MLIAGNQISGSAPVELTDYRWILDPGQLKLEDRDRWTVRANHTLTTG
jgi:hypothetical protein